MNNIKVKVVEGHRRNEIEMIINRELRAGWELKGNLVVTVVGDKVLYSHVMIKERNRDEGLMGM